MLSEEQLEQYLGAFSSKKDFTLKLISSEFGLSDDQISGAAECLDWAELSKNTSIEWTDELIRKHEDRWVWPRLSSNDSIRWTIERLREFRDKLTFGNGYGKDNFDLCHGISYKANVEWSAELIAEFHDCLDFSAMSGNEGLPWTTDLLRAYSDKLSWYSLSKNQGVPWTFEMIEEFNDKLYLRRELRDKTFASNSAVKWDIPSLELVCDRVDWNEVSSRKDIEWSSKYLEKFVEQLDWSVLCANENFPWDLRLMKRYSKRMDLVELCKNPSIAWNAPKIKWLLEQAEKGGREKSQSALQVFTAFCANTKVKWSEELMHIFLVELKPKPKSSIFSDEDFLKVLSSNPSLPFTDGLIKRFRDYWNWTYLTSNKGIKWSHERILKFQDYIDWAVISGGVESVDYSANFIDKYAEKLTWSFGDERADLSRNPYLPWSSDFIEYYKKKIKWHGAYNMSGHWGKISYSILEVENRKWSFGDLVKYNKKLKFPSCIETVNCDDWDYDYLKENPDLFPDTIFKDNQSFFKDVETVIRFHDRLPELWRMPDWLRARYRNAIEIVGVGKVLEYFK